MPKPPFRFLIVPLGAVSMIASMANHDAPQARHREGSPRQVQAQIQAHVREQVVDCGALVRSASGICLGERPSPR